MRIALIFVFTCLMSISSSAQEYMEKIAADACQCVEDLPEGLDKQTKTLKLGLCMLTAAEPYAKKLKKDFKIDFNKIEEQGEDLGRLIGIKMAAKCPEALILMADLTDEEEEETLDLKSLVGQVTNISKDQFVVFSIQDDTKRTVKLYWLDFFSSELDMPNAYSELLMKMVGVTYTEKEFFDPRINEYKVFKVIISLDLMQN